MQDAIADGDAIQCDGISAQEIVQAGSGQSGYALVFWQDHGKPGKSVVVFSAAGIAELAEVIVRIGLRERARSSQSEGF